MGAEDASATPKERIHAWTEHDCNSPRSASTVAPMPKTARPSGAACAEHATDAAAGTGTAVPAFEHGARVEWYNRALRCWRPGVLGVISMDAIFEGEAPEVSYEVVVGREHTLQRHVQLDAIRAPLCEGDDVEVFVDGRGWQSATIAPTTKSGLPIVVGYDVRLSGDASEPLSRVPAKKLRRCFPAGSDVEVYRGAALGWVPGKVLHRCRGGEASGKEAHWTHEIVLLEAQDAAEAGAAQETVPSYLLRQRCGEQ